MSDRHALPPYSLRMTSELRQLLEESAKKTKRSLNAEIVARLEESFAPASHRIVRVAEPAAKAGGPELDEFLMNVEIVLEQLKMFTSDKDQ